MIDTVVIPAAGLGTRLFTITKENPKEMVPIFYKTKNDVILLKPLLEIIFENLYDSGFKNFCFIVGRGKETIEDHFSPHYDFIEMLKKRGEDEYVKILSDLYKKIEKSSIVWIRQHSQNGIGSATMLAKDYVGNKPFLFHAGDLYVPKIKYLKNMIKEHGKADPSATVGIKKVRDPKRFGVVNFKKNKSRFEITNVVEKPKNPSSNYILTGINIFEKEIFEALKNTKPGVNNEIQLTDGIQTLIKNKKKVVGSLMNSTEPCIDIGLPNTYFEAIKYSYNHTIIK